MFSTYKKDDVNDDQDIFDEVNAAAIGVAILWFLYFDLFLRLLFLARRATSTTVVVIVMAWSAILGWFIRCHCTSGFSLCFTLSTIFLMSRSIQKTLILCFFSLFRSCFIHCRGITSWRNQIFNSLTFFCSQLKLFCAFSPAFFSATDCFRSLVNIEL